MKNPGDRKILFVFVTLLVVLQLFLFFIYEQYSKRVEKNDITNLLIQKNMALIQRAKASPLQNEIIKNIHIPHSNIILTANPIWPTYDTSSSLWEIYGKMKH